MDYSLQFKGSHRYLLELARERIFHPQKGEAVRLIEIRRNDSGPVINGIVKDEFGRPVNLQGARIKMIMRKMEDILGPDEEKVIVSTQDRVTILNQLDLRSIGEFQALFNSDDTSCAGKYQIEFQIDLKGVAQNFNPSPYELFDGSVLTLKVDGSEQTITFDENDFDDITEASATEVVDALNAQLSGATAYSVSYSGRSCSVLIVSDSSGGSIEMTGGSADEILGFDSTIHRDQRITLPTEKLQLTITSDLDEVEEIE